MLVLAPGARLLFDGELVEVVQMTADQVAIRTVRSGAFANLSLVRLLASCRAVGAEPAGGDGVSLQDAAASAGRAVETTAVGTVLACLTSAQREEVSERAGHVREVLTGFRSGHRGSAGPGEPRPQFAGTVSMKTRCRTKARELGVTDRTVERWIAAYRDCGEAGLVDARVLRAGGRWIDPRWDDAVRLVLSGMVDASTPTRAAVLDRVEAHLQASFGPGEVALPSRATAYRRLGELAKGTNAVTGSAKGRRSIADRPRGTYGRLRATRPGEFLVLDTQDLDVFAMEPVTCRWVRAQLTVAQDLFTRCILGLRVTPVSTKAVDVAGVLYDTVVPRPAPASWPQHARWPYHGVPSRVIFAADDPSIVHAAEVGVDALDLVDAPSISDVVEVPELDVSEVGWRGPVCAPETLVVDHGKVFLSAHVIGVCTRLGISIQPAQPYKPTDKPTVERFFKTLREGLIQYLPAYKGPDIYSRGDRPEDETFLFIHELEDVIREWVAAVYHCRKHEGLCVPQWPGLALSPYEMFELGQARAGMLRIPATPDLAFDFLPVAARTIQHYGVEVGGLRYNGPALDGYRDAASPYGGALNGKWPIRVNPDDVRYAYFQDPADGTWHRLEWEHAAGLSTPFSDAAAKHARRLAVSTTHGEAFDPAQALRDLLSRWDKGMVTGRRERHAAVRLAAQYAAQPLPTHHRSFDEAITEPVAGSFAEPLVAADLPRPRGRRLHVLEPFDGGGEHAPDLSGDWSGDGSGDGSGDPVGEPVLSDDDDGDDGEDFYADAFEVVE